METIPKILVIWYPGSLAFFGILHRIARVSSSCKLLSPSPLRWSGGTGGDPSVAQGLQHRLCGLHQGRGGGRRGAPPGGGRLKQPHNTTMFRRQITRQRQNVERNGNKETLPPTPSIAPMSPAVIIFYFCILFIAFYMERKLICRSDFCFIYFVPFFLFFFFFLNLHLRSQNTLSFCFSAPALHLFFQKAGVSAKRRYFILVSFVVLKQTPTLKKKKKRKTKACSFFLAHYLNTGGPRWWSLGTALSWCHIYRPHSPSMAYTSMNI